MSIAKTKSKQTNKKKMLKKSSFRQFCWVQGETDRKYPNV